MKNQTIMPDLTTPTGVLDELMAGTPVEEVEPHLQRLVADDRQTVLCTVCFILDDVRKNCPERADDITEILKRDCRFYVLGDRTCEGTTVEILPMRFD